MKITITYYMGFNEFIHTIVNDVTQVSVVEDYIGYTTKKNPEWVFVPIKDNMRTIIE